MKDGYHSLHAEQLYAPQSFTADANSTEVDMQGYEGCDIVIEVGTFASGGNATNYVEFTLQESDTSATLFTAVAAADLLGHTTAIRVDATSEDATLYHLGYVGDARYLRVNINEVGTVSIPLSITAIKHHGRVNPVN